MVIIIRNGQATWVQIQEEVVYISYSTNTIGKGMNPTILLPAIGKYEGRLCPLILV